AMAIRNITNAAILHRPMAALRDAASKSLRAVRIKKRPSIVCIGDVSRQDKAKFCQGFEFLELSLNQDLRDWANVAGEIGLDRDNARRIWRLGGAIGRSSGGSFRFCRQEALLTKTGGGPLPPSRQEFGAIPRIVHLSAEQFVKREKIGGFPGCAL